MSSTKKHVLVVARDNQPEALRMAAGLTLLDDIVKVDVLGALQLLPEVEVQKEVLDFADVVCTQLSDVDSMLELLAEDLLVADIVYIV